MPPEGSRAATEVEEADRRQTAGKTLHGLSLSVATRQTRTQAVWRGEKSKTDRLGSQDNPRHETGNQHEKNKESKETTKRTTNG